MKPQTMSPTPKRTPQTENLNFHQALDAIMEDRAKTFTKLEWGNRNIFGTIKDGYLQLRKADNRYYYWNLSDGDLLGSDYIIL